MHKREVEVKKKIERKTEGKRKINHLKMSKLEKEERTNISFKEKRNN